MLRLSQGKIGMTVVPALEVWSRQLLLGSLRGLTRQEPPCLFSLSLDYTVPEPYPEELYKCNDMLLALLARPGLHCR